jgi:hypothetical protein
VEPRSTETEQTPTVPIFGRQRNIVSEKYPDFPKFTHLNNSVFLNIQTRYAHSEVVFDEAFNWRGNCRQYALDSPATTLVWV